MSLRGKLFLLCFIALGVVITPIIYFTYMDVRGTTSQMEEKVFDKMAQLVEDNINQRYLNLLTVRVMEVLQRKSSLQKAASLARGLWFEISNNPTISDEEKKALSRACMHRLRELDITLEIIGPSGELFWGSEEWGLLRDMQEELTDFKGRTLGSLLASDHEYAVLNLLQGVGGSDSVLAFFMQVPEKRSVIVALQRIADMESELGKAMQRLIEETRNKISTFELYPHGFVTILDERGTVIAHHGDELGKSPEYFPATAFTTDKGQRAVKHIGTMPELGEVLFSVQHFDALQWTVLVAAPLKEIQAPSVALVQKLIYMALGGIVLVLFASMLAVAHLTRPLRLLTRKISSLPDMDFAAGDTEARISADLPLSRKDEVGQVAEAFSRMGQKLSANIRDLMDTTAIKERMQGELNAARDIQLSILPPPLGAPSCPGFSAAAFLEPAKEVGGDLYDFFTLPNGRQAIVIGDVSDKGVPAALFMSMTVTLVRNSLRNGLDPAAAMTQVNEVLSNNNTTNMFVTLFIGVFDPVSGSFDYANGGHCPPLVCSCPPPGAAGAACLRSPEALSGPVVGAIPGLEYSLLTERIAPGEVCFLYTDGVTEALSEQSTFFGEEVMREMVAEHCTAAPRDLLGKVYAALLAFRGNAPQSDDITMLAFKAEPR